jgi:hypothetical protein
MAIMRVTETAANTLTFAKLEAAISLFEKVAFCLHQIDYHVDLLNNVFDANQDYLLFGVAVSNSLTDVTALRSEIVDANKVTRTDYGTAGNAEYMRNPIIQKKFSELPGGGILVPPNPLYLFGQGSGLTAAVSVVARVFYTVKELKPEEYWELVEMRRVLGTA